MSTIKYKAAVLNNYSEVPIISELELPPLNDNDVLIKVMASSIMPSDIGALHGRYGLNPPSLPSVFGFEGSGIIEDVGKNLDKSLIGKHVGSIIKGIKGQPLHGNWAQYLITNLHSLLIFDKPLEFEKIFSCFANPMTSLGFIDVLKSHKAKSVVQNGASTALGKQFIRLCSKEGIELINIVRKESAIEELKLIGGKNFVNSSEEGWEAKLTELAEKFEAKYVFECVGGDMVSKILTAMPIGSTMFHYGNLEGKYPTNIPSGEFIFKKKTLTGFWTVDWLKTKKIEEIQVMKKIIKEDFENGGEIFSSDYRESFKLEDIAKALDSYKSNSGRILIKPWE